MRRNLRETYNKISKVSRGRQSFAKPHGVKVWWCNQRHGWKLESSRGVVCSEASARPKYRQTVGEARKGDIIVHYVTGKGIVAISRAIADGRPHDGPNSNPCGYQRGWFFDTDYFKLSSPVHRDAVKAQILALKLPDSPVLPNGRVRQQYFLPFTLDGLRVIREASTEPWPPWAEAMVYAASAEDFGNELREVPPEYRASVEAEIGRIISESAKHDPELTDSRDRTLASSLLPPRTAAFRLVIRQLYGEQCAVCGLGLRTPNGRPEVEAAHIYPKALEGSDDLRNGICLCRLHRWAFDAGWFSLSDDLVVLVRDDLPNQDGYERIGDFRGASVAVAVRPELRPHPLFLAEHRKLHGFG